ncbi:hypothetical protein JCGZ_15011 [Jatropha curcas]|uniref:Uncharacterized protein n=1 Tax=Jatropha curcas TaxID=180498 RepID=A0A067K631_JATCU|nr:hypothetical protein JCGZ_15011 [Jatropha curcas]
MVGISWQLLTQIQDFLLGTGVLPGPGVPGSGSLKDSARVVLSNTVWRGSRARACAMARPGACASLEVWNVCSTGVLQLHGPSLYLQCGHGRARLWKSRAVVARACGSAWAGACAPLTLCLVYLVFSTGVLMSTVWGVLTIFCLIFVFFLQNPTIFLKIK